jgi:hypothetical protein
VVVLVIWVIVALLAAGAGAYLIWKHSDPSGPESSVDPEQAVKAAVELHHIRSNFDVSWIKSQQRRDGVALRREIAEIMKAEDGD